MSCPAHPTAAAARRARQTELRHRLLSHGGGALGDAECLELLCGLAEAEAPALLAAFGSLPEVLGAAGADLTRVAGPAGAARIKLVPELADRLLTRALRRREVLSSTSAVIAHLRTVMVGAPREQFRVLFLDKKNQLIASERMDEGTVDHAPVYPREVVRRALELNAVALVLAHNHPSGDATPSRADIEMTAQVVAAAHALRLVVHDHLIVAGEAVSSLRALGLM